MPNDGGGMGRSIVVADDLGLGRMAHMVAALWSSTLHMTPRRSLTLYTTLQR